MQKWEYQEVPVGDLVDDMESILDRYGDQGWEMVSVIQVNRCRFFYFKRRILVPVRDRHDV